MKVSAILKGPKDDHGRQSISIRVNDGQARTFKATKIRVTPAQFKSGKVVNHPKAKFYNDILYNAIIETEAGKISGARKYPDPFLSEYLKRCIDLWHTDKSFKTLQKIQGDLNMLIDWAGDIRLSRVSVEKLNDFRAFLNKKYKGSNTVWRVFRSIRTIYTHAMKERMIEQDPFIIFEKPVYKQPRKTYLTQCDVDRIERYALSPDCPPVLKPYAVWFLIGCYTGLRFSDMSAFDRKENIKGGRMVLYTAKTGELVSIPLNDKIRAFFEHIDYRGAERSNQKFNQNLKALMAACDIDTNMTVHLARHTFAVRCATAGIPIEVTAKLMAQTDTKSTAVYYKITNSKVDQEFEKLF